jgi:hypothetical protein
LLDSSKAIQKIKKDKIQTFKEFLGNRLSWSQSIHSFIVQPSQ